MNPMKMAGISQKLLQILYISCPPNYNCGGPSYAAVAATDSILHLMGIGVAMLQRRGDFMDTAEFQKEVRKHAVTHDTILGGFVQHKSQILAGALHAIVGDIRNKRFRECLDVTEQALLSLMQWYFTRSGQKPEEFMEKLKKGDHDELLMLESSDE